LLVELTYQHGTDMQAEQANAARRCERCACSLCGEFQGRSAPLHTLLMPHAAESRVLSEGRHWLLVPTIGPLAPGHLMLVPRSHYYSVLSCPEEVLHEGRALLEECASKLRAIYGRDVVVFEHGATPGQEKVCGSCIEHAHLHVVPGPSSFVSAALGAFDGWRSGASLAELRSEVTSHPYMLVGQLSRGAFYARRCLEPVPSQILRRILARELGDDDKWDWRRQANEAVFVRTINDWRSHGPASQTRQG
jgi:ATP adenylyltransferase